jgi:hypothetical protein
VAEILCPYCGEPTDTFIDEGGGDVQEYIEDCAVCCRPIRFRAVFSPSDQDYRVEVSAEP